MRQDKHSGSNRGLNEYTPANSFSGVLGIFTAQSNPIPSLIIRAPTSRACAFIGGAEGLDLGKGGLDVFPRAPGSLELVGIGLKALRLCVLGWFWARSLHSASREDVDSRWEQTAAGITETCYERLGWERMPDEGVQSF